MIIKIPIMFSILFLALVTYNDMTHARATPVPVKAEIVTSAGSISPGGSFKAGVLFDIEPGWHIYWKNPGDSGLPTKVEFRETNGLRLNDGLYWPVPHTFTGEGGITDFGYEDELLLWQDVSLPSDYDGESVTLKSDVSWVSCREICIPGRAELSYELPVNKSARATNGQLFGKWVERLPIEAGHKRNPFDSVLSLEPAGEGKLKASLSLTHGEDVSGVELITAPGPGMELANISYESGRSQSEVTFDLRFLSGEVEPGTVLYTLLAYERGGDREAVEMPLRISE